MGTSFQTHQDGPLDMIKMEQYKWYQWIDTNEPMIFSFGIMSTFQVF